MRRLAITGFCAIALLSGCGGGGGGSQPRTKIAKAVDLKCPGKNVKVTPDIQAPEGVQTTITFNFGKKCNFTHFGWLGFAEGTDPPGFSHKHSDDPSVTIVVYEGTPPMNPKPPAPPGPGYTYTYVNDDSTPDGNGSGVVKN